MGRRASDSTLIYIYM
ncbi:hypothetical protein F383_36738 [Gossypium arboreum]|uniref:Uncharacterized protein n=1 Tax=Gossypium arboreum TaxID=29729 RepID=A0A0B0M9N2_GOSAR|nr:hypothetical protein F383_36738 [Gossypium arboreum]